MKTLKEFHLYDWFMVVIVILLFSTIFYSRKYYLLKGDIELSKKNKDILYNELLLSKSAIKEQQSISEKEIDNLKKRLEEKKKIKIVYKTEYEKIYFTPDSIQLKLTDSILAVCRTKQFKRH